jgi:hypothetical protein
MENGERRANGDTDRWADTAPQDSPTPLIRDRPRLALLMTWIVGVLVAIQFVPDPAYKFVAVISGFLIALPIATGQASWKGAPRMAVLIIVVLTVGLAWQVILQLVVSTALGAFLFCNGEIAISGCPPPRP